MKVRSIGRRQTGDMPISNILMLALVVIPLVLGGIYFLQGGFQQAETQAKEAKKQQDELNKKGSKLGDALN